MNTDYLLHIKKLVIGFWPLSWYKCRSEQLLRPSDKYSVLLASGRAGSKVAGRCASLYPLDTQVLYIPRMSLSLLNHSGPNIT